MEQYTVDAFTDKVFGGNRALYAESEIYIL